VSESTFEPADDDGTPYTEGTVWSVQFARTQPGTSKPYLRSLAPRWKPLMDEARRRKLILDYRILLSPLAHREDWDVMIVVEIENMAALDGYNARLEELARELEGGSGGCVSLFDTIGRPPDFVGMKLLREVKLI
jgi:hypothetical protein